MTSASSRTSRTLLTGAVVLPDRVVSDGAVAVTLNVTATETTGAGFVTVWPCDRPRPTVSNLNVVAGQTVPNAVSVQLAANGTVCLFATTGLHLLADVAGYATAEPDLALRTILS